MLKHLVLLAKKKLKRLALILFFNNIPSHNQPWIKVDNFH